MFHGPWRTSVSEQPSFLSNPQLHQRQIRIFIVTTFTVLASHITVLATPVPESIKKCISMAGLAHTLTWFFEISTNTIVVLRYARSYHTDIRHQLLAKRRFPGARPASDINCWLESAASDHGWMLCHSFIACINFPCVTHIRERAVFFTCFQLRVTVSLQVQTHRKVLW